jgi:putative transposase
VGGKGKLILLEQRKTLLTLCETAMASGARQHKACEIVGISAKTLQRWRKPGEPQRDGRETRVLTPANKLSEEERQKILAVSNSEEFSVMTPNQIVPVLAERGQYIGSERTFYRVLKAAGQLTHRQKSKPRTARSKPDELQATKPGQLLSWDITYLKTLIAGQFYYLYLFMDLFSRKIVGWQIYDREDSQLAADIVVDIAKREGYDKHQVDIHSDNGSPMKGATILATFHKLGITPSYSRPSVSNDNPYSESLFKTLKYCPHYPSKPFNDLLGARQWMSEFAHWYNHQHRHSGIHYVTPAQRHAGLDKAILVTRSQTYKNAKEQHPERWSGKTRDWCWQETVVLNPDKVKRTDKKETTKLAA